MPDKDCRPVYLRLRGGRRGNVLLLPPNAAQIDRHRALLSPLREHWGAQQK